MFYTLGNILSPKTRHAESTDTRQEIRRQDPDEQRRSDQEHEEEAELFSSEDDTVVSIIALRAFLENFLKSLPSEEAEQSPEQKQKSMKEDALRVGHDFNKGRPVAGNMKHAMGAYQSAAKSSENTKRFSTDDTKRAAENLGLEASEVRTIHTLIEDLKTLSDQKIDDLVIERSTSFLQSLVNAVEKLKYEIN